MEELSRVYLQVLCKKRVVLGACSLELYQQNFSGWKLFHLKLWIAFAIFQQNCQNLHENSFFKHVFKMSFCAKKIFSYAKIESPWSTHYSTILKRRFRFIKNSLRFMYSAVATIRYSRNLHLSRLSLVTSLIFPLLTWKSWKMCSRSASSVEHKRMEENCFNHTIIVEMPRMRINNIIIKRWRFEGTAGMRAGGADIKSTYIMGVSFMSFPPKWNENFSKQNGSEFAEFFIRCLLNSRVIPCITLLNCIFHCVILRKNSFSHLNHKRRENCHFYMKYSFLFHPYLEKWKK